MAYLGDSVGKRLARACFWLNVRDRFGAHRMPTLRFAYLASREGGDASCLSALGVLPEQQLAIDADARALESFRSLHPKVPTRLGRIEEVIAERQDVLVLDFCSNVHDGLVQSIRRSIQQGASPGSLVCLVYKRGREGKDAFAQVDTVRSLYASYRKQNTSRHAMAIERKLSEFGLAPTTERIFDGRTNVLWTSVNAKMPHLFFGLQLALHYHSRTEHSAGSPMATVSFQIQRTRQRQQQGTGHPTGEIMDLTACTSPAHVVGFADMLAESEGMDHEDVARMLNVDRASLAAWRAHDTRGSYEPNSKSAWRSIGWSSPKRMRVWLKQRCGPMASWPEMSVLHKDDIDLLDRALSGAT